VHEAVTDTGPFIHLDEIQHLELLPAVFKTIIVPEQVIRELTNPSARTFIEQHPKSILIEPVPDETLFATKDAYSGFRLHLADLAILVLINKYDQAIANTDDLELRKAVESSGRTVVGTIGILFRSYKMNIISNEQLRSLIDLIFNDSSLYLNGAFKSRVLDIISKCP
jgi:predicted nucleic acid-binding protein